MGLELKSEIAEPKLREIYFNKRSFGLLKPLSIYQPHSNRMICIRLIMVWVTNQNVSY